MPNRNDVILLRHCVRSNAGTTIRVCDVDKGKARKANLAEFVNAPLPEWGVPPLQCTERGFRIIQQLGKYLVNNVVMSGASDAQHVVVRIISDDSQRDWDTSLALMRGMKAALKKSPYSGLDQISINHNIFGSTKSWPKETTCPSARSLLKEQVSRKVLSHRISHYLPLSDFHVRDVLDRLVIAGTLDLESIFLDNKSFSLNDDRRCPGGLGLSLNLLDSIAEMAAFSRASRIHPPFLPSATDEDVYRLMHVSDYINSIQRLDNKSSAKRGLILMKSMLEALLRADGGPKKPSSRDGTVTVTVYVGHNTNVNDLATALGLRWALPPPYVRGSDDQIGRIVSVPPGSGMIFSSIPESNDEVSVTYVAPVNLLGNGTVEAIEHQLLPIYTIGMTEPELAIRDGVLSKSGAISAEELKRRLEATMTRYPDLRPCHEDAPIFLGLDDFREETAGNAVAVFLLAAIAVVNLIGCSIFAVSQYRRSGHQYKEVQSDELSEDEVSHHRGCIWGRRGSYNFEVEMKVEKEG